MRDEPQNSTGLPALVVALRDGAPVRIRLVRPDDRARLLRGVREMSRTSRYMRFFATTREMSDDQARYFTEIDQINHVAVCAGEPTDTEDRGYGIARFVRDANNPYIAEFAVAVIDEMQGRGLGTVLIAGLYLLAQARGIRELRGDVLAENPIIGRWLLRLSAKLQATHDSACQMILWPVLPAGVTPPVHGAAKNFIHWLERLRSTFGH